MFIQDAVLLKILSSFSSMELSFIHLLFIIFNKSNYNYFLFFQETYLIKSNEAQVDILVVIC